MQIVIHQAWKIKGSIDRKTKINRNRELNFVQNKE